MAGFDSVDADRLLGIIGRRCVILRYGASWQTDVFRHFYQDRALDRLKARRQMTRAYREQVHSNEPVHSWPTG